MRRTIPGDVLSGLRCGTLRVTINTMPSVNIRQLRDTRRLKELLSAGQDRGTPRAPECYRPHCSGAAQAGPETLARLCPPSPEDLRERQVIGSGLRHRGARALLSIYADTSFFVSLYLPDRSFRAKRNVAWRQNQESGFLRCIAQSGCTLCHNMFSGRRFPQPRHAGCKRNCNAISDAACG